MSNRLILPDAPDPQAFGQDTKTYLAAVKDWMQRTKGNLFTQSIGLANATTTVSTVDTDTTLHVLSDGTESWGSGTYVTDGSGVFSITHGLPAAPQFAIVLPLNPGANVWLFNINTLGSTTIGCTAYNLGFGTPLLASTSVTAQFLARKS